MARAERQWLVRIFWALVAADALIAALLALALL